MLELQDVPEPEPAELLVDVDGAGVNYRDVYEREGRYGGASRRSSPASRARAASPATGERVVLGDAPGSYAEQVARPAPTARCRCRTASPTSRPPPRCCRA